jgi:hypothetical protein
MTNRFGKLFVIAGIAILVNSSLALAQDDPATDPNATPPATPEESAPVVTKLDKASYPAPVVDRPLQVIAGMIEIAGNTLYVNLSKGAVGKPVGLAPSVFYGITDKFAVGIFHIGGICLTGEDNGCGKVYNDIGIQANYYVVDAGKFLFSAHAGLPITSFDPFVLNVAVGGFIQYSFTPKFAILLDPTIQFTITERDLAKSDGIALPVWLGYQATPQLWAFLSTAFGGPFDGFGDAFTGALGVGATYAITNLIDVGLEFQFTNLYGKRADGVGAADGRILVARFAIRL